MKTPAPCSESETARAEQKLASRLRRTAADSCPGEILHLAEELAELTAIRPQTMNLALEYILGLIRVSKIEGLRAVRAYTMACPEAQRQRINTHPHMLEITRIFLDSLSDPGLMEALGIIDWSRNAEIPEPPAFPAPESDSIF